ncbi:MAG: tyrosine-type recombinase/integrase [Bacteroidia bacterium]|nr:tyrosine-type recombinase/integrase [Bacteroidia bacterium]
MEIDLDAFYFTRYSDYLQFEKHYSVHTVKAYLNDAETFLHHLIKEFEIKSINEVTHLHIKSWLANLIDKGSDPRSVRRNISSLRNYYKYLLKHNILDVNPMIKIVSPKMAKKLPVFIEESRMEALFENELPDGEENDLTNIVLLLLYHTGIRLSELTGLKSVDIDLMGNQMKVLGKRNKERIIPFGNELKDAIIEYRSKNYPNDTEFLLATPKGNKLYPQLVYKLVKRSLESVTTLSKKSPHVLRHTFATHLLNRGADLNAIKELLGHAGLAATQIYTQNSIEKLKNIHNLAHPKG